MRLLPIPTWSAATAGAAPALAALAVALAVALALGRPPVPVLAVGGGIEVVKDHWEVRYPDDLSFALTVEGERDIAEVRLFYRPAGSDVWSYAYPDFTPGARVTARLDLSVGGSTYVPSGVEVEYYYRITDVQGNVHRTAVEVLEVIDQRFQWERTQVGPLLLLHHHVSRSRIAAVTQEVESSLALAYVLLGLETGAPMRGVVYNTDDEAAGALPWQSQTIADAQVFGGYAFPAWRTFVAVGFSSRLLSHEAAHLLLHQALGERVLPVPAWFDEGFATYVEPGGRLLRGRRPAGPGLPLTAMTTLSGTPRSIPAFYQKSGSVMAYLVEEHGAASFRRLVQDLARGGPFDDALVRTYGFDTAGLDGLWAGDARTVSPQPSPPSAGGSPWASFSSIVLAVLAVGVSLAVAARFVFRRLRRAPESGQDFEDGLQPWEDPDWEDPGWDDDAPPPRGGG